MLCWAVVLVFERLGPFDRVAFMRHYMGVTWWRGGCGLSSGGVSRLWEASLAWWLLVEEATSQRCDFGMITFNTHVRSTNVVVSCLAMCRTSAIGHSSSTRIHPIPHIFLTENCSDIGLNIIKHLI